MSELVSFLLMTCSRDLCFRFRLEVEEEIGGVCTIIHSSALLPPEESIESLAGDGKEDHEDGDAAVVELGLRLVIGELGRRWSSGDEIASISEKPPRSMSRLRSDRSDW